MMPDQVVGRDGAISVPYAGRVHVVGRPARAVQEVVERALAGKALQPQVMVNVVRSVANSVTVGGEVASGARIPLSVRGDRLLDVLAAAGGVRAPVNETFVELTRGPRTLRVPLQQIVQQPSENIYLHSGDVLTFVRSPQTFLAYGATGRNAEVPFDADGITLAQALSKAGGLLDERSDPAGVFIFRQEVYPVAQALRPGSPLVGPRLLTPVIYHLNLRDPQSLFLAQNFRIAHHDLVYVADSPSTNVQKVFGMIGGGMSTIGAGAGVAAAATTFR
jgi:polysaccharide export outer membrane protein